MTRHIEIDDQLTMCYVESGRGTVPIVLVPGWTMSSAVFEHQLGFFAESDHYRCIAIDPRAHGSSSQTEGGHFYEQHGRDLQGLIEGLDLTGIVLVGWSFGTLSILSWVNQFGADRLSGLVMLDGPPRATGDDPSKDWVTYRYDDADGSQAFFTMGRLRDREATNRAFARWMLENPTDEAIEWLVAITNQMPDTAAALLNASANFVDYRADLIALSRHLPLWYVVRQERSRVVTAWAERYTPNAKVTAMGKHMMFRDRPQVFNAAFADFLEHCNPVDATDQIRNQPGE